MPMFFGWMQQWIQYNWKCLRLQKLYDFSCWKRNRLKSLRTISGNNIKCNAYSTCNTICSAHTKIEQLKLCMRCRETVKLNAVISSLFIFSILISKTVSVRTSTDCSITKSFSLFSDLCECINYVHNQMKKVAIPQLHIERIRWSILSDGIERNRIANRGAWQKPSIEIKSEHVLRARRKN